MVIYISNKYYQLIFFIFKNKYYQLIILVLVIVIYQIIVKIEKKNVTLTLPDTYKNR